MLERVDKLIVVAGPSCCGKSVFLQKLVSGELPNLTEQLGISDFNSWMFVAANRVPKIREAVVPRMVLHYALPCLQAFEGRFVGFPNDPQLAALRSAQAISVATLYVDPATLLRRVGERKRAWNRNIFRMLKNFGVHRERANTQARLEKLYASPVEVRRIYEQWFAYCQSMQPQEARIIHADHEYKSDSVDDWSTLTAEWPQSL